MHNHILPGIDDGAVDIDESHKMRIALKHRGIDTCIFTPHIYQDVHPNTKQTIKNSFDLLMNNVHYQNEFGNDRYAAEYMLDAHFEDRTQNSIDHLCIKDKKVLVEFTCLQKPPMAEKVLFNLQLAGYTPIIAHPERYNYLNNTSSTELDFIKLKDMGCELQLNLLSLQGKYGSKTKELAKKLLKQELYDYASTDIHNPYQLIDLDKLLHSYTWKKWCKYPFKNQTLA